MSAYSADKWKDGQIPLHYQMQCQHYLAVSGCDAWYIAALILGKELIIHCIERDEELIQNLIIIEERFWHQNILQRKIPDPDGSDSYTDALNALYQGRKEEAIQLFGVEDQLNRRRELDELIDKLEQEKEQIDQSIKLQMKDASLA